MNQISFNEKTQRFNCVINGEKFTTAKKNYVEYKYKTITGVKMTFDQILSQMGSTPKAKVEDSVDMKFSINERFGFVEKVVSMVASGVQASAVITGEGGLGKSFTVLKTLKSLGLKNINDLEIGLVVKPAMSFIQIKGFSTAKSLYRSLFENNGACIIFDDCDSILKDQVAVNILKGALDSYDERVISWNSESRGDDDLPRSFSFTGKIIFISNIDQNKIDQAIRSRSMLIDLTMTTDQKLDRMAHLVKADDFMEEYSREVKMDALDFISSKRSTAKEISLRTLIAVAKVRSTGGDWKALAEYILCR